MTCASANRSTLTADAYGKTVEYHGTVAGLGVGTGSAFALLPAQNATGNWIKVVQRLPVRIALDPKELADHPLRVGLSMEVAVDVADTRGRTLANVSRTDTAHSHRRLRARCAAGGGARARHHRGQHGRAQSRREALRPARSRKAPRQRSPFPPCR